MRTNLQTITIAIFSGLASSSPTVSPTGSPTVNPSNSKAECVPNVWLGLECFDTDTPPYSYPIDWNRVSSSPSSWVDSNEDIGECICDMTSNMCDMNCHCDPDCTATDMTVFTGSLNEGLVDTSTSTCVNPEYLKVNERGELASSMVNGLLCVERSNDPNKGTYYDTTSTASDSEFNSLISTYSSSYATVLTQSPTPTLTSNYKFEDRIVAARGNSTNLYSTGYGYLTIPAKDAQSQCSDLNFAQFLRTQDEEDGECVVYTDDITNECTTLFNAESYGNNLWIGKTPTSVPGTPSGYVSVSLSSVWAYESSTGIYSYLGNREVPSPYFSAGSCMCNYALDTVIYTVNHTQSGEIVSASVDVVLNEVSGDDVSTCTTAKSTAKFLVRYYPSQDLTTSPSLSPATSSPQTETSSPVTTSPTVTTSNPTVSPTTSPTTSLSPTVSSIRALEPLPRSGNPGYRNGFPLLAGSLSENGTESAINRFLNGLVILGHTKTGYCTTPAYTERKFQDIRFNSDTMVGCKLSLTLDQLQSICAQGLEQYFATNASHIAQWGNSSLLNTNEWRNIEAATYTNQASWTGASSRKCSGIPNVVNWQILTKRSGSVFNPQNQIVKVRVEYASSDWEFKGLNATQPEDFMIYGTASFYSLNDKPQLNTPESPPLFPKLPDDTLYPLYTNSQNDMITPGITFLLVLTGIVMVTFGLSGGY